MAELTSQQILAAIDKALRMAERFAEMKRAKPWLGSLRFGAAIEDRWFREPTHSANNSLSDEARSFSGKDKP